MCSVWQHPNGVYDASDFWTLGPEKIFPHISELDLLGGEPFAQRDTFRLIDAVTAVNSRCSWGFVTNGHFKFSGLVHQKLNALPLRFILVSLDSLRPAVYEQIRWGGSLARVMATLTALETFWSERYTEERPFELGITMCVMKRNWREIHDFLSFAKMHSLKGILQFAYAPSEETLLKLDNAERQEIRDHLLQWRQIHGPKVVDPIYLPIQDSLREPASYPSTQ